MTEEEDRDIEGAARLLGVVLTRAERAQMAAGLARQRALALAMRAVDLPRELPPATMLDQPFTGSASPEAAPLPDAGPVPDTDEALALAPAWRQAAWLRAGAVSARRLTAVFLARIAARGTLLAFATVTEAAALARAEALDAHLAREGEPVGPLHGLPYGMKDLIDTAGVVTDWGAEPYRGRVPDEDAQVTTLLARAGAVLLGKTAVGALAYGDLWYGGQTRNPWNEAEGASGSSAGSASAVAAGLCAFAIGTETYGSIISPASRCRCVGLRPGFGRVSRRGVMTLCPSLDKVGVLARAPLDTALVLGAIVERDRPDRADRADPAHVSLPFTRPPALADGIRIGWRADEIVAETLREVAARTAACGAVLVELAPRPALPWEALIGILEAEAAASFVDLTASDRDDLLAWQDERAWPNTFRRARFLSAVDHVQLDRLRRRAMQHVAADMAEVDAFVSSPGRGPSLLLGNFTGHPCLGLPGFGAGGVESVSLLGRLLDEARLVALGQALAGPDGARP